MSPATADKKPRWHSATISDVAELAGVSKATVSIVLNSKPSPIKVSESTRQRILNAAKELSYSPNRLARAFSTRRSNVLGVVTSSAHYLFASDYSARVLKGIAQAAHEHHYNIMIFDDEIIAMAGSSQSYVSLISSRHVDGIIVISPDKKNPSMAIRAKELKDRGMPFVFVWRRPEEVQGTIIRVDNLHGVKAATEYLLSLGHKDIAVITHGKESQSSQERLTAFEKVLRDHQLVLRTELIFHDEFHPADDHNVVDKIMSLPQLPTAIFAFYDPIAINVINILADKGIRIPEQISVVGFGDLYTANYPRPILTTVKEPVEQIGYRAVSILVDHLEHHDSVLLDEEITFDPVLVVRASCGPAPMATS